MTLRQADSRFIASQGFFNKPVSSTLTIDTQLLRGWPTTRKGCMKTSQDAGTHVGPHPADRRTNIPAKVDEGQLRLRA